MSVFVNYKEFVDSGSEFLDLIPELETIDGGTMIFTFLYEGEIYVASGSHCRVGDYNWSPGMKIKEFCDFDNFWLYMKKRNGMPGDEVCNW